MSTPDSTSTPSSADLSAVAPWLYLSATIMVVAGIVLGVAVGAVYFVIVGVGLIDGVLAYLFSSGRLSARAAASPDDAAQAEADPSYNPYARED